MRMKWFSNIFSRKASGDIPVLAITGIRQAPMTAEPDDREIAAQALMESLLPGKEREGRQREMPDKGTKEYYLVISERVKKAYNNATLEARRFLVFSEQELKREDLPLEGEGSLAMLEAGLIKHLNTINREGGEMKKHWQDILADISVRQYAGAQNITID